MRILAIETSCDETAICLIEAMETPNGVTFSILGNVIHSQIDIHREYGGVFPALAKREHQKNLPIVLEQVFKQANLTEQSAAIDHICVTSGPGLEPALWTGIVFAQELGAKWNIPVTPVNHMEGHILSVIMPDTGSSETFTFEPCTLSLPALALLISGGHTELILVNAIGDYKIIGKTRDDAVGEAFDKVARILGLPYPGGPEISKLADLARTNNLPAAAQFPRPMIHTPDFDFSFSGLKTAVLYYSQSLNQPISDEAKQDIAREFENAVSETLIAKTKRALNETGAQTLIVAGGVSANRHIVSEMKTMIAKDFPETDLRVPTRELTGDNAVMIALAGYFKIQKNPDAVYGSIRAEGNLNL